ncbi:hypothetical protein ACG9ZJ_21300 [Acinetobacter sp. ULE_I064]|uniref:hypothetical protein n=1 Tax=Acinetobacter sp. ULE_I064 TaxID=3373071 RepID=UPI003AF7196B
MASIDDVIIESDRDEKTLIYLIKVLGERRIIETIDAFKGGKRFYVSNIAKSNKVDVPDHIYHVSADREEVKKILAELKAKLRKR